MPNLTYKEGCRLIQDGQLTQLNYAAIFGAADQLHPFRTREYRWGYIARSTIVDLVLT